MKKLNKRILLFLILMLFLASGLSYLGFNQVSTKKTEKGKEEQVMAMNIALVNEDDGATFNGNELSFGETFIKSMDKDESHDWYVVSRGVAESGLENNTYDMMIIIPNDFSVKALSMDSESPEQVSLNYKINASGNQRIQSEAEKTASEILNDVNRRIIDVYFASIISNLQNAQDNIGSIVERQAAHTSTYNNSINDPLSSYTDRFSAVQDNTEASIESFSSLEEILDTFDDSLNSHAETNRSYLSAMEDYIALKDTNNHLSRDFLGQLNDFSSQLSNEDISQQLVELEAANEAINNQLQQEKEDRQTAGTDAVMIQSQLENTSEQITNLDMYLQEKLDLDMNSRVKNRLSGIFEAALDGEEGNLSILFDAADNQAQQSIQNQINKLPYLNMNEIRSLGLSEQTVTELENVKKVTDKYNKEFGYEPKYANDKKTLPQLVQEIKTDLANNGVVVKDTVNIPEEIEEPGSIFKLKIPEAFKESGLTLTLNNKEVDYEYNGGNIILPPLDAGELTVQFNLKLRDAGSEIDVFQPVGWSWEVDLADIKDIDESESAMTASVLEPAQPVVTRLSTKKTEEDGEQKESDSDASENDEHEHQPETPDGSINEKEEDTNDSNIPDSDNDVEKEEPEEGNGEKEGEDPDSDGTEGEEPDESEEDTEGDEGNEDEDSDDEGNENNEEEENDEVEEPETIHITNHKIQHQIESSLTSDSTESLINAASDTVGDYQRMIALYENYFGIDIGSSGPVGNQSLKELATDDSLYTLFNEPNVADVLENYMVNLVTDRITAEVREPIERLQDQIQTYNQLVNEVDENADQLAEDINRTTEEAEVMNNDLEETLDKLAAWREESIGLIDEQEHVQSNRGEEQSVFMTMGNDLQSIFSETESLASQAATNLNAADSVYQTFDAIDEQARDIQESGVTLVEQAETLSVDMTETLLEDQNFADNFAGVLANSRVGDRQNEDLYEFLSNPVETKNDGVIGSRGSSGEDNDNKAFLPYYLVLICFIVALFTAYVISTNNQKRAEGDQFAQDKSIVGKNLPLMGLTAGIGVVEGLVIGLTSGYLLQVSGGRLFLWIGMITLIMLAMLLVATYLLRQLKMIGMFILLAVLSLYLFLTDMLAISMNQIETVRMFSPLQHVETMFANVVNGTANGVISIIVLIGITLIGVAANLFVLHQNVREETEDEDAAEAN